MILHTDLKEVLLNAARVVTKLKEQHPDLTDYHLPHDHTTGKELTVVHSHPAESHPSRKF